MFIRLEDEITLANIDESSTLYTWIKYADDALGNGMSDTPEGKAFMGIAYNKLTQQESTNPSDYQWIDVKGESGIPGPPGTSTYTWIKYSLYSNGDQMQDDPNGMLYMGIAYNKNTPTESTDPAEYEWARFRGEDGIDGKPGTPGEDGISPIVASVESTQGNFFKQGIGTTTLKVTVFQGGDNVTAQCNFEWYKIDAEAEMPDPTWHKSGNNITITQDDVNAKSTFFVTVSYTNLTALANYTISDLFDMNPSIVPPANPQEGQVWLDISKDPAVLMVFSNGKWQPSAKDWSGEIKEITDNITIINTNITNVQSDITNLNNEIKLKVSQDTFDETTKILNADISGLQDNINNLQFSGQNLANLYGDKKNVYVNLPTGASGSLNEFEFTIGKTDAYSGLMFEGKDIIKEDGATYILSYKLQKISGVVENIGGHLDLLNEIFEDRKVFVNGVDKGANYNGGIALPDTDSVIEVVFSFKKKPYSGTINNLRIGMELNRGKIGHNQQYKIWDVKFEKATKVSGWTPSSNDMIFLGRTPENINILRNTGFNDLEDQKKFWSFGGGTTSAINWSDGLKCNFATLTRTTASAYRGDISQKIDLGIDEINNLKGKEITFSCFGIWNSGSGAFGSEAYIRVNSPTGDKIYNFFKASEFKSNWTYVSGTITIPNIEITSLQFTFALANEYSLYIAKPMLNIGNKAYAWTPSPKDVEKAANDAKAQAIIYTDTQVTNAKSEIQVKIDEINLSVEQNSQHVQQVIKDLNDLTLDTYNLIDYSSFSEKTWAIANLQWTGYKYHIKGRGTVVAGHINPSDTSLLNESYIHLEAAESGTGFSYYFNKAIKTNVGEKYTLSAFLLAMESSAELKIYIKTSDYEDFRDPTEFQEVLQINDNKFHLVTKTFIASKKFARVGFLSNGASFAACHPMFSQATKYVPWQVSPVELGDRVEDNVQQIAQIKIDVGSVTTTVSNLSNSVTQINGNVEKISQRLSTAEQKIEPDAITNTVTSNTIYQNDIKGKIDAVQVGGRNLIFNSGDFRETKYWSYPVKDTDKWVEDDVLVCRFWTYSSWGAYFANLSLGQRGFKFEIGKEYTASFRVKTNVPIANKLSFQIIDGGGTNRVFGAGFNTTTDWQVINFTFKAEATGDENQFRFITGDTSSQFTFYVDWVKLEEGNKATDWSPAPEDVQDNIDLKPALNLLYNSGFTETGAVGWNRNPGTISWWTKNDSSAMSGKRIELSTFGINQGIYQRHTTNQETLEAVPFEKGLSIVYSGYIYSNKVGDFRIGLEGAFTKDIRIISAQTWTYFEVKGIANGTAHTSIFYSLIGEETLWTMKDLKLEYGTKATPWNVGPGEIGNRLQQSELKLTPESIVARVYEKAQGSNLIANSAVIGGNFPWRFTLNTQYWTGFLGVIEPTAVSGWCMRLANDDTTEKYAFSNRFGIESGKPITISFDVYTEGDCKGGDVYLLSSNDGNLLNDVGTKEVGSTAYNKVYVVAFGKQVGSWKHYSQTFYPEGSSAYIRIDHNGATNQGWTANRIWIRNLMVNKGEIEMPWSDNTGSVGEAELKITSDSIIAKVESGIINGNPIDASSIKVARDGFTVQNAGYWTNLNGPKMDVRRGDENGPLATRINYGFQVFNDSTSGSDYLGGIMKKQFSQVDWYMSMIADEDTYGMGFYKTQGSGGETDFGNPWMVYNHTGDKQLNILTEVYFNDHWLRGIRMGDGIRMNYFYQKENEMNVNRGFTGIYFNYTQGPDTPTSSEVFVKVCNGNKGTGKLIANVSATRAASFMVMPSSFKSNPMPVAETFSSSSVQPLLEDIGEITIAEDGEGYFALSQTFITGINNTLGYQVITEKYSRGDVEFVERFPTYFIIHGTPGMRVGFIIKGKVEGEEARHLEPTTPIDDGKDVGEHSELVTEIMPKIKQEEENAFNTFNHEIEMTNNYRPLKRQKFEIKEQEEFEKLTIQEQGDYIQSLKEYLDSQPSNPMTVKVVKPKTEEEGV